MARLPTPILEELIVDVPDDLNVRKANFYSMLGQIVRAAEQKGKKEGDKNEN